LLNILTLRHKNGVYLYGFKKLKLILKFQWIFNILLSLFVIRILGVHANLSKCGRGTGSGKVWEPLIYSVFMRTSDEKVEGQKHTLQGMAGRNNFSPTIPSLCCLWCC